MIQHFRIERLLGKGGFAFTYLAWDTELGRNVAVKELFPHEHVIRQGVAVHPISSEASLLVEWKCLRQSFTREARHLARFRHPNIVSVVTTIETNNTAYIVMQYVEGRTLGQYFRDLGHRPTQAELLPLLGQILHGLEEVHARGMQHRDIKPQNIYLTRQNTIVLLDFGAARPEGKTRGKSTFNFRTDGYSPLEQYSSTEPITPASDIYAVAATLVQAITRQDPPKATDRISKETYVPLSLRYRRKYSSSLLRGIDMGMALKAAHRPQSIAHWRSILFGKPPPSPPRRSLTRATLVFALFVCLVIASTAAWIAVRMGSQNTQTVEVGSGKTATTTPDAGPLFASAPDTPAASPPVAAPATPPQSSQSVPAHSPPLVAKNSSPPSSQPPPVENASSPGKMPSVDNVPAAGKPSTGKPPAVASTAPPPRAAVAAVTSAEAPDLDQEMNAFLKAELEQPMRPENYASSIVVNDSGLERDRKEMSRDDFIKEDQADEARYTPGPGQFTHLGSKRLSYDKDTDTAVLRQIFSYDRTDRGNAQRRFFGLVVRQMVLAKASTRERCVTQRIVTARASGYRCRLSAADHPGPALGTPKTAGNAALIRAILLKDRENVETGAHVDAGEDMRFPFFQTAAGRAKISTVPDAQVIVIPGGEEAAQQIISANPVVDVFPDLSEPAPAIVIVVKS